jgi:hypothetical protein
MMNTPFLQMRLVQKSIEAIAEEENSWEVNIDYDNVSALKITHKLYNQPENKTYFRCMYSNMQPVICCFSTY